MKRALLVGVDAYVSAPLFGCETDAIEMTSLLGSNDDGSPNFDCRTHLSSQVHVGRALLRESVKELFATDAEVALFYFSGHGCVVKGRGGLLVTQDAEQHDEGIDMNELLSLASSSKVREVVLILDCCFSGAIGDLVGLAPGSMILREGLAILAASRGTQPASATPTGSVFTNLLRGALLGGAADVVGKVNVASVYGYVDQTLSAWDQRPMFKANLTRLTLLRNCKPEVSLATLRKLPQWFPTKGFEHQLDPSYEPDAQPRHSVHEEIFACFQRLRDARLLVPVDETHLYYAAMNSKSCRLTGLGEFYRELAERKQL